MPHSPAHAAAISRIAPWAGAMAWLVVAWWLYEPAEPRPFDILDFSEFLPLLQKSESVVERLRNLTSYYMTQGRLSVVGYAMLVGKWTVFGNDKVLWQLGRVVQMAAVAMLLYMLLRRWGISRLGAAVAMTLPLLARVAAPAWVRLNMAEPLGTAMLLGMMLLASHFNDPARRHRAGICIGTGVVLLAFLKEMLLVALPAVWLIALVVGCDGTWSWRRPERAHVALVIATGALCVACAVPILYVATHATPDAYSTLYGATGIDFGFAIISYMTMIIPFVPIDATPHPGVLAADLGFLTLLMTGWRPLLATGGTRHARWLFWFALLFPLLGVAAYLPWPIFQPFYGLPFLLGTALLVGGAITGLQRAGARAVSFGLVCWSAVSVYMLTAALHHARRSEAAIRTSHDVIQLLREFDHSDSLLFAVRVHATREWFGLGPTLRRQAATDGIALPPVRDVLCADARSRVAASRPSTVIVGFHSQCGAFGPARAHVAHVFSYFDWRELRVATDSSRADVLSY